MSIKKSIYMTALLAGMMASDIPVHGTGSGRRTAKKTPLNNKQKKARNKSKRAKKARK